MMILFLERLSRDGRRIFYGMIGIVSSRCRQMAGSPHAGGQDHSFTGAE
jgi:hypothetical protein